MKIAVYAIAKNEAKHVHRFMASTNEADGVFVLDTGSTDNTVELLRSAGAHVVEAKIEPWSFATARNQSLALVPVEYDACVYLDLDEVLVSGWREKVEYELNTGATLIHAFYTFAWSKEGEPALQYFQNRAHIRHGYVWQYVVHECLKRKPGQLEKVVQSKEFQVHHHQDFTKARTQYLTLLEQACREDPENDRHAFYLGREYLYRGKYDQAIRELTRHLRLPSAKWEAERAASMRLIAKCYCHKGNQHEQFRWLLRACAEMPNEREGWVELAQAYQSCKDFVGCYYAAKKALSIEHRDLNYLSINACWGAWPYDLAAVSGWFVGAKDESLAFAKQALALCPDNERLRKNVEWIEVALRKG